MKGPPWKVGELAKKTGLTVRTLHHYDDLGLLCPTQHTESGHRLYTASDLARLQSILSLRQLGFSLDEISGCLDKPEFSPKSVLALHIERLKVQLAEQQKLIRQLEHLNHLFESAEEVSADEFVKTIEEIVMVEKYYTKEQLAQLKAQGKKNGQARIKEVEAEWPRLMAEVQKEMDNGTDPKDPRVIKLAERWQGLINEFTGGDPGITQSLNNVYQSESSVGGMDTGPIKAMAEFLKKSKA